MAESHDVIKVVLDRTATESEVRAVKTAFNDAGLPAEVEAGIEFRSATLPPWVIEVTVLAASGFFGGFVGAVGADAWKGLRDLVAGLFRARKDARAPKGTISVRVTDVKETVLFVDGLPDVAFKEITETELTHTESGQLQWDPERPKWRDAFDVARDS